MSQQDFENSQFNRRATDGAVMSPCACGKEVLEIMQKMQIDIRDIRHGMGTVRTAFVRNDLGDPDYEGHRQAHIAMIKKHESVDRIKETSTAKIVGLVLGAIVLVFMSGLGVHIQKIIGG
jgi:hypothetical protein